MFAGLQGGWVPSATLVPSYLLIADTSSAHLLPCSAAWWLLLVVSVLPRRLINARVLIVN